MLQKFLSAIVAEEWAKQYTQIHGSSSLPPASGPGLAQDIISRTLAWLQGKPPSSYHEMAISLGRIHSDCVAMLHMFSSDCKLPTSSIPFLGNEIDLTGTKPGCFTIDTAQAAVGTMFTRLKDSLGRTRKKELAVISDKRTAIVSSIARYNEAKVQHDTRVSAAFAAAYVAFRSTPDKVSPVVKGIMNGIKVFLPSF